MKILGKFGKLFRKYFLDKYLNSVHPSFLGAYENIIFRRDLVSLDKKNAEKRIINRLTTKKYLKYFYNAINYNPNSENSEQKQKPTSLFVKWVSLIYVIFFDKNLYKQLILFEKQSIWYDKLNNAIDSYINDTTISERLNNAKTIGIITENNYLAHKRLLTIKGIV